MGIDVRVAGFIGGVIEHAPAGHPGWIARDGVVLGHRDGVVTVIVGDVDLAVRSVLDLERDFGPGNSFSAGDFFHDVVGKGVSLGARRATRVFFGQQRGSVDAVGHATDDARSIVAAHQILRLVRAGDFKPLNFQIKSQHRKHFARVALQ